jgi:putative transcriptional regulator
MQNIVKQLRVQRGLTQEQLAKDLEVTRPTVSNIERCVYTPKGHLLIKISQYFGKPAEQIFFEDDVMLVEQNAI